MFQGVHSYIESNFDSSGRILVCLRFLEARVGRMLPGPFRFSNKRTGSIRPTGLFYDSLTERELAAAADGVSGRNPPSPRAGRRFAVVGAAPEAAAQLTLRNGRLHDNSPCVGRVHARLFRGQTRGFSWRRLPPARIDAPRFRAQSWPGIRRDRWRARGHEAGRR